METTWKFIKDINMVDIPFYYTERNGIYLKESQSNDFETALKYFKQITEPLNKVIETDKKKVLEVIITKS